MSRGSFCRSPSAVTISAPRAYLNPAANAAVCPKFLAELQAKDPRVRVIRFRRNFGQTAAFAAGFAYARGALIVTSDGDLQNDPRDIPGDGRRARARAPTSSAAGARTGRTRFFSRRLPSMIANRLISWATGVRLHDYGCSLKVFRAEVVKPLKLYGEMHRFLPAIASEQGVTIAEVVGQPPRAPARHVEIRHLANDPRDPRPADGEVPAELLDAAAADLRSGRRRDGLLGASSSRRGSRISGCSAISRSRNRPLLLFGILLIFTGVQLVTLGLLAELQARTYHESQDKPTYVIREIRESRNPGGGARAARRLTGSAAPCRSAAGAARAARW